MTDQRVVFRNRGEVEIDIWAVVDGGVVLGEAKIGRSLETSPAGRRKKAIKLRRAAEALTADMFVLATAAHAWTPGSIDAVKEAFAGNRCQIQVLTNVDPYWADG